MDGVSLERPVPADLTVCEARDAYLLENGFSTATYDDPAVTVNFWGIRFTLPNPPSRRWAVRWHDLHHVITGYGSDPVGEAEISAWELRRGIGPLGPYVGTIVLAGALMGLLIAPRRASRAWARSNHGPSLFHEPFGEYTPMLAMKLGELRERLGVHRDGLADNPRALHADAPAHGPAMEGS